MIKSEVPLGFWKLLLLFLERTLIAIPIFGIAGESYILRKAELAGLW